MKTYDYINRVVLTLPLRSTRVCRCTLLLLVAGFSIDRSWWHVGIFLKLLRSPTVVSEARFYVLMLYARVEHKWVVGDISHTAYQHVILWFGGIVGRSGPDWHYAYAYARPVLPMCFAHRWLAGDSFSNFSWTECGYARSLRRLKRSLFDKLSLWFWCVGDIGSCLSP